MKYLLEGHTLTIQDFRIDDTMTLLALLKRYQISKVIPQTKLNKTCLFLIKKYARIDATSWDEQLIQEFNAIDCKVPALYKTYERYKTEWLVRILYVFSFRRNTNLQDRFWLETFNSMNTTVLLHNVFMVLLLFFCIGIAVSFLLYSEFSGYGIQMESAKMSIYSGVKILCPMFTGFMIMSKSCTALSIIILNMYENGDPRIMQLMGLPFNRVYLNPLFFSLLLSGPIMNIVAIVGLLLGCVVTWVTNGNSSYLFLSILRNELTLENIIDSTIRAGLVSLAYGVATCIGGTSRRSTNSIVTAVNSCVLVASIGNVLVQAIVSVLTTLH